MYYEWCSDVSDRNIHCTEMFKKGTGEIYKKGHRKIDFENLGPEIVKKILRSKKMEINTDKIAEDCIKAINEKIKNLKTLNIIVAGKTGVGKAH